jgi:hypothetical protein
MNDNVTSPQSPGPTPGENLDAPLQALVDRLEQEGRRTAALPSLEYRRELRRSLMNHYETSSTPGFRLRPLPLIASAISLIIIGVAVFLTWQSLSTIGRPVAGGLPEVAEPPAIAQPFPLATLTDYRVQVLPQGSDTSGPAAPSPIELTLYWYYPGPKSDLKAFVHVVDPDGNLVAQADGPLTPQSEGISNQTAELGPDALAPTSEASYVAEGLVVEMQPATDATEYTVMTGVYDPSTSQRLNVDSLETNGPVAEIPLFTLPLTINDSVSVTSASPGNGRLSGTDPITIEVHTTYQLASLDSAVLDVRLVTPLEGGGGGRGVATTQVPIRKGTGRLTVPVVLHPLHELSGPSDIGLWVQIRVDERSAPVVVDMPAAIQWRWEP